MNVIRELTHTHVDLHLAKANIRRTLREFDGSGVEALRAKVAEIHHLLVDHIDAEEKFIFPDAVELAGSDSEVVHLIEQHKELSALTARLLHSIDDEGPTEAFRTDFEAFDLLFEKHSEDEAVFFDRNANLINPASAGGA